MEYLETSFASSRLLAVPEALLRGGQRLIPCQALVLCLLLRLLIREAVVIPLLQLLVEPLHQGERDAGHHLELPWVNHTDSRVPTGEGDDGTSQEELVHIQEVLLLNAEIREKLRISPKVL
jgi:hypothetical protein